MTSRDSAVAVSLLVLVVASLVISALAFRAQSNDGADIHALQVQVAHSQHEINHLEFQVLHH